MLGIKLDPRQFLARVSEELARINDKAEAGGSRCEPCNSQRIGSR